MNEMGFTRHNGLHPEINFLNQCLYFRNQIHEPNGYVSVLQNVDEIIIQG